MRCFNYIGMTRKKEKWWVRSSLAGSISIIVLFRELALFGIFRDISDSIGYFPYSNRSAPSLPLSCRRPFYRLDLPKARIIFFIIDRVDSDIGPGYCRKGRPFPQITPFNNCPIIRANNKRKLRHFQWRGKSPRNLYRNRTSITSPGHVCTKRSRHFFIITATFKMFQPQVCHNLQTFFLTTILNFLFIAGQAIYSFKVQLAVWCFML